MDYEFDQSPDRIRLEWGLSGAEAIGKKSTYAVVIDVLTFTTALSVSLDLGSTVYPYPWKTGAGVFAQKHSAAVAYKRGEASSGQFSLSPGTLRSSPAPDRLVLPSPNGSTISHALIEENCQVMAASLRNAVAVGNWLAAKLVENPEAVLVLIPAGEKWPDGSLRPAVEDLWGAGAVVEAIRKQIEVTVSEEALLAANAYQSVSGRLEQALSHCSSGKELVAMGYADDVATASEHDSSTSVPLLRGGRFTDATRH